MIERAVVNSGPLVALSITGQLDLLPALYAECWAPQTVFNEVAVAGICKPGATSIQAADWQARVRLAPIPDPLLVMELDAGEAEVISLARQLSPCMAIIDERRGRRIAQQVYGLPSKQRQGFWLQRDALGWFLLYGLFCWNYKQPVTSSPTV